MWNAVVGDAFWLDVDVETSKSGDFDDHAMLNEDVVSRQETLTTRSFENVPAFAGQSLLTMVEVPGLRPSLK